MPKKTVIKAQQRVQPDSGLSSTSYVVLFFTVSTVILAIGPEYLLPSAPAAPRYRVMKNNRYKKKLLKICFIIIFTGSMPRQAVWWAECSGPETSTEQYSHIKVIEKLHCILKATGFSCEYRFRNRIHSSYVRDIDPKHQSFFIFYPSKKVQRKYSPGLPYANPPLGALRFARPQPLDGPWPGVRDGSKFGPSCPQPFNLGGFVVTHGSEDCLTLNVYVPDRAAREVGIVSLRM